MDYKDKTKEQLIKELTTLRRDNDALNKMPPGPESGSAEAGMASTQKFLDAIIETAPT